jgi:hypothetical protein
VSSSLSALNIFLISVRFPLLGPYISSDWAFMGHISRAIPTEMIFYLLRSIPSEFLIPDYPRKLNLDTLEIIIEWLQVSISECNRQTTQTLIFSRVLVPNDQATCIIAFRVNFFLAKLSLYQALPSILTLKLEF